MNYFLVIVKKNSHSYFASFFLAKIQLCKESNSVKFTLSYIESGTIKKVSIPEGPLATTAVEKKKNKTASFYKEGTLNRIRPLLMAAEVRRKQ